jgi:hypothetical protein
MSARSLHGFSLQTDADLPKDDDFVSAVVSRILLGRSSFLFFSPNSDNLQLLPAGRLSTRSDRFCAPAPFLWGFPTVYVCLDFLRLIAATEQHVRHTTLTEDGRDFSQ